MDGTKSLMLQSRHLRSKCVLKLIIRTPQRSRTSSSADADCFHSKPPLNTTRLQGASVHAPESYISSYFPCKSIVRLVLC
ncbi:7e643461-8655-4c3a-8e81-5685cd5600f1 [Sclerotinia trifoliorum]|uniref:7e643461-8655-4c3a-8e81-5685cd5600f1 n=1 Tax=Sclerotinia trifoliorum TaxID=28548 RepID=A0A8H2VNR3_9HELO|nr:7e643461-8655-4c3a-8e81-5685cd5600f1 [Sclerotinia trifoliorum]